jgi:hypothetical protein
MDLEAMGRQAVSDRVLSPVELAHVATAIANGIATTLPSGFRVVVIVAPEGAQWFGCGSTTSKQDTDTLLRSALIAMDQPAPAPPPSKGPPS